MPFLLPRLRVALLIRSIRAATWDDATWPIIRVNLHRALEILRGPGPRTVVELTEERRLLLRAALGFLRLEPRAPELRLLHRWLDTWTGIGLIAAGLHRQGLRLSLSHIAEGEWRCVLMGHNPMLAPKGFGVAATPWRAVPRADA